MLEQTTTVDPPKITPQALSDEDVDSIRRAMRTVAGVEASDPPVMAVGDSEPGLRCINIYDFLRLQIPSRDMLLTPILPRQGLCMIHAARGIGKTYIALSLAYAVASGGNMFGRWAVPQPARVLFLDGEMPACTMQERLSAIVAGSPTGLPDNDYLRLVTPDLQGHNPMPNLATQEGQEAIEPMLDRVDLVIVDNLATLARSGKANDEDAWAPVQAWLLGLRRRGISVILVHHQGKSGDQRGTSAKEDILDVVIRLDRPEDYRSEQGARFEVHFTKARGIYGDEVKPFEVRLISAGQALTWTSKDLEDAELDQLRRLFSEGCTIRDAAEEMQISKSRAGRLKKKIDAMDADIRNFDGTNLEALNEH